MLLEPINIPNGSFLSKGEIMFVLQNPSKNEINKDWRTKSDKRQIDKSQTNIARLNAHSVS